MKNIKYEWDFHSFFQNDEEFLKLLKETTQHIEAMSKKEITPLLLPEYYKYRLDFERLEMYAILKSKLDMKNTTYQKYVKLISSLEEQFTKIKNQINKSILKENLDEQAFLKKYPTLKAYQMHIYEVLRLQKHQNYDDVIQLSTSHILECNHLYSLIMNVEMVYNTMPIHEKEEQITFSKLQECLKQPDRQLREQAFHTYFQSLKRVNQSISSLLLSRATSCVEVSKRKEYASVLEQETFENDLDLRIFENMQTTIREHLPLLKRYYELKKQSLNLPDLAFWDLEYQEKETREITFEEALKDVIKSLEPLGTTYQNVLKHALQSGCLDIYPKPNKFSNGVHYRNYIQPMILMNFHNQEADTRVLAHELGHSVNGLLIRENHPFQDFHFSIFLSEIASKTNEFFLDYYHLKNSTGETKKNYIEEQLQSFVNSVFVQTMYFECLKDIYSKIEDASMLGVENIQKIFETHFKEYYPNIIGIEEETYIWQTRVHHFHEQYRFYNYQYVTGYLASLQFAESILKNEKDALKNYLEFLKIGGSMPTLQSLKVTGVDFTKKDIFENGMKYFENLLEEYELILRK